MTLLRLATALAGLLTTVNAHFTLDYPPARGPFVAQMELQFCSGYPVQSNNRSLFPLTGGQVDINSHHPSFTVVTLISFDADPQNFTEFNTTSSGQTYGYLKPFLKVEGTGELCIPVDVSSLGVQGVTNGTNATILVQVASGDGVLYSCSDVTLVSSQVSQPACTNASTVTAVSSTNTTTTNTTTTTSKSSSAMEAMRSSSLAGVTGLAFAAAIAAAFL